MFNKQCEEVGRMIRVGCCGGATIQEERIDEGLGRSDTTLEDLASCLAPSSDLHALPARQASSLQPKAGGESKSSRLIPSTLEALLNNGSLRNCDVCIAFDSFHVQNVYSLAPTDLLSNVIVLPHWSVGTSLLYTYAVFFKHRGLATLVHKSSSLEPHIVHKSWKQTCLVEFQHVWFANPGKRTHGITALFISKYLKRASLSYSIFHPHIVDANLMRLQLSFILESRPQTMVFRHAS